MFDPTLLERIYPPEISLKSGIQEMSLMQCAMLFYANTLAPFFQLCRLKKRME